MAVELVFNNTVCLNRMLSLEAQLKACQDQQVCSNRMLLLLTSKHTLQLHQWLWL